MKKTVQVFCGVQSNTLQSEALSRLGIAFDILFDHGYIKGGDLIYCKVSYAGVTEFVIRLIILGWTI